MEYHRQEAQRIQDQLFELEHYHKDIVARFVYPMSLITQTICRYQEEIEYLKRQLEHADHGNTHDSHVLNSMKYEKQRVLLPPGGPRVTAFGAPNLPPASRAGPGAGGLPGVLSSLGKTDPVVAGVVSSGGAGNGRGLPPPSGVRVGTPGLRGSGVGNGRPVERGVLVVGGSGTPIEGGEESAPGLIIEEQDIVMASVNPSDK